MTFIIFVIVLGVLVLVHELGHFLAAKKAGVYVEEFGFGYPPRAISLGRKWGTIFSINWIPFGGFVKIFGENYEDEISSSANSKNLKFTQVSKKWQAIILAAGVIFNIFFAWVLFSVGFMIGVPAPLENSFGGEVKDVQVTIVSVLPDSPAEEVGLKPGDRILNLKNAVSEIAPKNSDEVSNFISSSYGEIDIEIDRGGEVLPFSLTPSDNITEDKKIIGVSMEMMGTLRLPPPQALYQGAKTTVQFSYLTVAGILGLILDAFRGTADVSQVSGPIGIIGLVGDATRLGFSYLLTFTALISINLAIVNLLPFPALDGGRLVFVAYEGLTKKKVNQKFAMIVNSAGFALLITLMIFITYRDILKLL